MDTDQQIVKTDSLGLEEWRAHYSVTHPDSFQQSEEAYTIQQLPDGGYFVGGSGPGGGGAMIVRTDSLGEMIWVHSWDWREFSNFWGSALAGNDHLVVIAEWGEVAEFDGQGDIVWSHRYGLTGSDMLTGIVATQDGGYIICGRTYGLGDGSGEMYAVKIDHEGEVEWRKGYGLNDYFEVASGVTQLADGGYCFVGGSEQDGHQYGMIVRTDNEGNEIWGHIFNEGNPNLNYKKRILELEDGGIAMASGGNTWDGGVFYLDRLDVDGNYLWSGAYPTGGGNPDVHSLLLLVSSHICNVA